MNEEQYLVEAMIDEIIEGAVNVQASDISNAENNLKLKFSNDYKKYITNKNMSVQGSMELTKVNGTNHNDVVIVTNKEKSLHKGIPKNMYVIENLGIEGIIILQDAAGNIYEIRPEWNKPRKIFNNLKEYIDDRSSY